MKAFVSADSSFECKVPHGWIISNYGEEISFSDPEDMCAITFTIYRRTSDSHELAADEHLERFLEQQQAASVLFVSKSKDEASANYEDDAGRRWLAMFLESKSVLLLATMNAAGGVSAETLQRAENALATVRLID